ncbi:MAG: acyl--CoA ligase [Gammaproteobacteria bacterium]|nr:acyl--CoA ligase [Gammaproteobacteria bacterium]
MITSPQQRIDDYTAKGWWGNDTLHSLLGKAAQQYPERLAVADQPNRAALCDGEPLRLSFAELDHASDRLAEQLLTAGVSLNDKLIVQLPNIAELVVVYYAASKLGAVLSPVPVQYGQHELNNIRNTLGAQHLITTATFQGKTLAKAASEAGLSVLSFGADLPGGTQPLGIEQQPGDVPLLAEHRAAHGDSIDNANRILTICWTSGTTGTPKGVPRSHNMWLATTHAEIDACDFRNGDLLLNPFPLVNMAAIGGFLFPAALQACSLFLHHPLDPPLYLQQLQNEKITFTIAPPALLNQLAKSQEMWQQFDFSALRRVGSGSAPLAPWMVETFARDYGIEVINFYGSNEGICLLSTDQTSPEPEQRATMFPRLGAADIPWQGNVFEFAKTRVISLEDGSDIEQAGQAGELVIAGPTIFDGYFPATDDDDVFTEDSYFRTGDLVEICGEPAHYYRITGRCKDIINRGGVKISPTEIDRLLEAHPGLAEVAVCAYADARLGEKMCACVVPTDADQPPALDELTAYLIEQGIASFKLPERLELFDALPRNPMGKVLRFQLQEAVEQRPAP